MTSQPNNVYDADGFSLRGLPTGFSWGLEQVGDLTKILLFREDDGVRHVVKGSFILERETLAVASNRLWRQVIDGL